ncbi:MAG: FAD-dependent oxidoreductase [Fervidicoccaceae archaeon]
MDVAVLGCGWAGALLAYSLAERYSVVCLEKEERPGGLLRSETLRGFTVDVGGSHVIFSRDRVALDGMLGLLEGNVISRERESYVELGGALVPYPFENGLYALPPNDRAEALVSFVEALLSLNEGWVPKNLEEWIKGFFGKWIAERYLIPYNRKVWKRSLDTIDVDWIYTPGRLPIPDWRDVLRSAAGVPTRGYIEQATFYYPLRGGIEALHKGALERARRRGAVFITRAPVRNIVRGDGRLVVNGLVEAKKIVSTIPLPELVEALDEQLKADLTDLAKRFDHNRVVTVAVALVGEAPPHHWVYVPDERVVFHRYAWLSNYSPYNAPPGASLVLAEVSVPPGAYVERGLADRVVRDLERAGVIEGREVIATRAWVNDYGYPIHSIGLREVRERVLEYLRGLGIFSVGRWGEWRYLNMDAVMRRVEQVSGEFFYC